MILAFDTSSALTSVAVVDGAARGRRGAPTWTPAGTRR